MPRYPFEEAETHKVIYLDYGMAEVPSIGTRIRHCGHDFIRIYESGPTCYAKRTDKVQSTWPHKSNSLRVPRHQVPKMREHFAKLGGHQPEIDNEGYVVSHNRRERNKNVRAFNGFDMDAGWSDPSPS